ncbi:unnamed protein product [Staurois parvus]|uniref:Uncharacterized protein n=1 Tax=Staurois parvus TaxID=386267 RepID=A0ABN9EKK4_9NEOB|nr:unnamed protein product [Staurois parvus]
MYTQTHVRTYTQTHMYIHTCTCTHIHVHTGRHMYRYTHVHTHTHTHLPYKKLQYFVVHSQSCTLGGGREHITHSFLCFHCAQLLGILTAPSANDRSGLSSEPAQQDGPGKHTHPHHNFHSPLASRQV